MRSRNSFEPRQHVIGTLYRKTHSWVLHFKAKHRPTMVKSNLAIRQIRTHLGEAALISRTVTRDSPLCKALRQCESTGASDIDPGHAEAIVGASSVEVTPSLSTSPFSWPAHSFSETISAGDVAESSGGSCSIVDTAMVKS